MITTLKAAESYIYSLLEREKDPEYKKVSRMDRVTHMLSLLGNPHRKLKIVHIAGTSGKGSTSNIISALLSAHGFKVGLYTSPHLVEIRERIKVNDALVEESAFIDTLKTLVPLVESLQSTSYRNFGYFELLICLSLYVFSKEGLEYAVIETGLGGMNDYTNIFEDQVVVLTRLGLDHVDSLGPSLNDIATHKAGIIHASNPVIVQESSWRECMTVLENRAKEMNADLYLVKDQELKELGIEGSIFNFSFDDLRINDVRISLKGDFQIENTSLAISALYILSKKYGFSIDEEKIKGKLTSININGRLEVMKVKGATFILDSAHNALEVEALINNLKKIYKNKNFILYLSLKRSYFSNIIKIASQYSKYVYITDYHEDNIIKKYEDELKQILKENCIENARLVYSNEKAINELVNNKEDIIVITGCMYLLPICIKILNSLK